MNRELLQEAAEWLSSALKDIDHTTHKHFIEAAEKFIVRITVAGAAPQPDAMEILRQVRDIMLDDEDCYVLPDSEAASLIEDFGKRVPRAMMKFPRQPNKEGGWTIEYSYLEQAEKTIRENEYCSGISMEQIEAVLLFAEERMKTEADKFGVKVEW